MRIEQTPWTDLMSHISKIEKEALARDKQLLGLIEKQQSIVETLEAQIILLKEEIQNAQRY